MQGPKDFIMKTTSKCRPSHWKTDKMAFNVVLSAPFFQELVLVANSSLKSPANWGSLKVCKGTQQEISAPLCPSCFTILKQRCKWLLNGSNLLDSRVTTPLQYWYSQRNNMITQI